MSSVTPLSRFTLPVAAVCTVGSLAVLLGVALGLDGPHFHPCAGVGGEEQRRRKLQALEDETRSRFRRQEEILRAVILERITLLEGAAHLQKLFKEIYADYPNAPRPYPGYPHEEDCCRIVITRVRDYLESMHLSWQTVTSRLEEELKCRLKAGTLRLPAPPPLDEHRR